MLGFRLPFARRKGYGMGATGGGNEGAVGDPTLVFDQFTDTRAAGAVNGTPATPGPGTRTVTDTESKVTVNGAALVFAGGKAVPATNDPGAHWGAYSRQTGRVLLFTVNWTTGGVSRFGWCQSVANPDATAAGAIQEAAGSLYYFVSSGVSPVVGVVSTGVPYKVAIVLRSAGSILFIKGGAFTTWINLFADNIEATAILYAAMKNNAAVATIDDIRIPSQLWLPTPIAYDDFTRADGALGSSLSTGPDSQGCTARVWTGATWTIATNKAVNTPTLGAEQLSNIDFASDEPPGTAWTRAASWTITGGVAVHTPGASGGLRQTPLVSNSWVRVGFRIVSGTAGTVNIYSNVAQGPLVLAAASYVHTMRADAANIGWWGTSGFDGTIDDVTAKIISLPTLFSSLTDSVTSDVHVDATVAALTAGTQAGLVSRLDDATTPANFLIAYFDGAGNVKLDECVNGAYTNLISAAKAFTAGDTLRLAGTGTAVRLYHITAAGVATLIGATTCTANTNTRHGKFSTYSGNTFSGFSLFPTGTGNEYAELDRF